MTEDNEVKISLYNITEEMNALTQLIKMDAGEITEDHQELIDRVDALLSKKTDNVVGFVQHLEDQIEAAKKRKIEIEDFIKTRRLAIERLKDYASDCMTRLGVKRLTGELMEINKRTPPKVLHINSDDIVPPNFINVETVVTVDKKGLKEELKRGAKIDGVSLVEGKRSITFKTKALRRGSDE